MVRPNFGLPRAWFLPKLGYNVLPHPIPNRMYTRNFT